MSEFAPFQIWDFRLEYLGEMTVDGRLPARDASEHAAEGVRVSDDRRGGIFHVYVLRPEPNGGEQLVLGRRFDAEEPQLMTSRSGVASYRLTAGARPETSGFSMLFRIAGLWRGEGEGWTAVGGARAQEALEPVGGSDGLLALLERVPGVERAELRPGARGERIFFESTAITGPVAFWCMSRLMPLQIHARGREGLLPGSS